jgi:heptosyltransferase-3
VVIATSVIPALQKHFPNATIDFLVHSMAKEVVIDHPAITKVHVFDHFYLKKTVQAFVHHFKTAKIAKREIQACKYDLAMDLQPFFPNAVPFLHRSKIPFLLGYPTGGFEHLLNFSYPKDCDFNAYMGQIHLQLLQHAGISAKTHTPLPYYPMTQEWLPFFEKPYIVIHMGSSKTEKEWLREEWIVLIRELQKMAPVILTGKGAKESKECARVAKDTGAKDLSDRLNWQQFSTAIQKAQLVITVDSSAVHLAAAAQVPCVIIFSEINPASLWVPQYPKCIALINRIEAQTVSAKEVLRQARSLLGLYLH